MFQRWIPARKARAFSLTLLAVLFVSAALWAAEVLMVVEKEAALRRDKKTYSPRVAVVHEGELVDVIEREEPWIRVNFKGVVGWMNESSVTDDLKTQLSGTTAARGVQVTEAAQAGRGFDEKVEKEYKAGHPDLHAAYATLDAIQEKEYSEDQVLRFLQAGKLADFAAGGGK